jgi:hypothetical protein
MVRICSLGHPDTECIVLVQCDVHRMYMLPVSFIVLLRFDEQRTELHVCNEL